jgi:integrase/recombinase XerC
VDLVADYERHLRRLDRSPNTVACYIRTLRQAERELPYGLAAATTEELEDWIFSTSPARRGGGERGKTTRSHYVRILRGFGRWAADPKRPRLDFDATAELPQIKPTKGKPKPAREVTLIELLDRVPQPQRTWLVLAAYGGLRCCEISALDRQDVTAERIWLHGKGEVERYVPTHPLIWDAVKELPPGPVAVGADGARLTDTQVSIAATTGSGRPATGARACISCGTGSRPGPTTRPGTWSPCRSCWATPTSARRGSTWK